MGRTLKQRMSKLPKDRRRAIQRRADELIDEEMSLQQLRKALDQTQVEVAKKLGVGQDAVSRYEKRSDMLLSTLQAYVAAMGGRITIVAEFPDRRPVRISSLSDIDEI